MTIPITVRPNQFRTFALGVPGAMDVIRIPDAGYSAPVSRSEVVHDLVSGGTAVTRRLNSRRTWSLNFSGCTPETADILVAYYAGLKGPGPFCFIDPAWRNALSGDASTFGAQLGLATAWTLSSPGVQHLDVDPTIAPPPAAATSVVAVWSGAGSSSHIGTGQQFTAGVPVPDTQRVPPYLAAASAAGSVWAKAASGTPGVTLRVRAANADGSQVAVGTTTATLSTSWQRVSASLAAGAAAPFITLDAQCNTASSPDLHFAGAAVEYGVTTNPSPWVAGLGIPRVVISAPMGSSSTLFVARDHTLALSEI